MIFVCTCAKNSVLKISLITLCCIFLPNSGYAHSIHIFATASGDTITGSAYYPGGSKYRNGTIKIYSPDKQLLGQSKTDENGNFEFKAKFYSDHIFTVTTHDGHKAQHTLSAHELPEDLAKLHLKTLPSEKANGAADVHNEELQKIIIAAVSKEINPLRQQIQNYEHKIRLRDVLGGIGYILGITGIAFYFLGRKKSQR